MENIASTQQAPVNKGIHISGMHIVIILVSCLMSMLLSATAARVNHTLQDSYNAIDGFVACTETENIFTSVSDYLTEQARLYTVLADQEYMDNYIEEAFEGRHRESAIERLSEYDLDDGISTYLQSALEHSYALQEQELYALRLAAAAQSHSADSLPQEVREVSLTDADSRLAPEEMREKAQEMVFGASYQEAKEQIRNDMQYSAGTLHDATQQRMEGGYAIFRRSMKQHRFLIGVQFAATLAGFLFTILLVVLPLMFFVKSIQERKTLRVFGAYECRCLAQTCNTMFALNAAHEDRLRHQAEHDALTGLLNRGAYDALQEKLRQAGGQVGLLIIDVDKFKLVNDGYGHEMGDRVLKRVADLLAENFDALGHPARIGGDEFSVILTKANPDKENDILAAIQAINETLTHPADDLPVVSLSVGGAFSADGFTADLYKHADLALYEVKEHGRCGCRFYTEQMANSNAN